MILTVATAGPEEEHQQPLELLNVEPVMSNRTQKGRIYSIGYGALPYDQFERALLARGVEYLIDVRSYPSSKFRPEFTKQSLEQSLKKSNINYVFFGKDLGGKPHDHESFDAKGHVDYAAVSEREDFNKALSRLLKAVKSGHIICIMCAEGKPENCHRSKLIGERLRRFDIECIHILPDDKEVNHEQLREKFIDSQGDLFGLRLRSRGKF